MVIKENLNAAKDRRSAFANAFYSLDNKIKGKSGLTTRQRAKDIIISQCGWSDRTFLRILKDTSKINDISKTQRYYISLILDEDIGDLFPKTEKP